MTVWGVHNDRLELDLVGNGFVGIGWDEMGDLTDIGTDKDELKKRVAEAYPDAKPGAIDKALWQASKERSALP